MAKPEIPELENEYAYLYAIVEDRYHQRSRELRSPIADQIHAAIKAKDWDRVNELEKEDSAIVSELHAERQRAEDIIRWLRLDTQLREEGSSYALIYEGVPKNHHPALDTIMLARSMGMFGTPPPSLHRNLLVANSILQSQRPDRTPIFIVRDTVHHSITPFSLRITRNPDGEPPE